MKVLHIECSITQTDRIQEQRQREEKTRNGLAYCWTFCQAPAEVGKPGKSPVALLSFEKRTSFCESKGDKNFQCPYNTEGNSMGRASEDTGNLPKHRAKGVSRESCPMPRKKFWCNLSPFQ